jgi:hypothetical protein
VKKAIIIFIIATLFLAFLYLAQPLVKAAEIKDDVTGYFSDKGVTITTTSRVVEQTVVNEYKNSSPVSKLLGTHESKLTSLGEVTINDLVMDTYFPLGEETPDATKGEFDPFRNITIETPGKQWWDIHPSDEETAAYRNQLISDWEAAKEAAWYASLTDTPTPAPTGSATPAPTKTPGPKPSPGPKPVVAPAPIPPVLTPSPAPTLAPSGTPTPAPTMQPTPEPPDFSLTAEELAEVEKEVEAWYKANSSVEERDITTSVSFNGEKIREYINSYHPEWQVAYILSFMVEYFHDENPGGDETQISADVAEQICDQLIRGYGYELMIDYWSSGWGDKWDANKRTLSLEEGDLYSSYKDAVTGADVMVKLFDKIEMDYSENRREDEPDLLKEEWIEPFVLFRNIYAWSENLSFGDREGGVNEFGFYEQKLNSRSEGSIFLEIVSAYDFPNTELALMQDALKEMPESAYALRRWAFAMGSIKGREGGGYLVDRETITWLVGDDIGTRVSLLALDQVGKIYSNDLRNKEGFFDCSSLTHFLYKSVGINIAWDGSDVAASQCKWSDQTRKTKWTYYNEAEMIPGDLIFWETKNTKHVSYSRYKHVYHVGVYIGNGIIVDASSSVGCVVCREMWGIDKVVGVARPYE